MAGETYYYFLSLGAVVAGIYMLGILMYLGSERYLKRTSYKPGTPEYARARKILGARTRIVTCCVTLLLSMNLIYAIHRIVSLQTGDARFVLFFAPVATILLFWAVHVKTWDKMLKGTPLEPVVGTKKRKKTPWLV